MLCSCRAAVLQVGLSWLDRWAKNLSGKDQGPFLCHQICGALLAAEQTGAAAASFEGERATATSCCLSTAPAASCVDKQLLGRCSCCQSQPALLLHQLPVEDCALVQHSAVVHACVSVCVAGQGPDEVAAGLLDLMGDAAFEQVGTLLEKR